MALYLKKKKLYLLCVRLLTVSLATQMNIVTELGAHAVISRFLDIFVMNPAKKGCMGAAVCVKEGRELRHTDHKPWDGWRRHRPLKEEQVCSNFFRRHRIILVIGGHRCYGPGGKRNNQIY